MKQTDLDKNNSDVKPPKKSLMDRAVFLHF